jgi:asparaginyl-tRNA synthetase
MFHQDPTMSAFALSPLATLLSPSFAPTAAVEVGGWISHARFSKRVGFLALTDGSSVHPLQVVLPLDLLVAHPALRELGPGCSVRITGEVVPSLGPGQTVELRAQAVTVLGKVADPQTYPIQPKPLTDEFLRTVPHLRGRTTGQRAIARLRHGVAQAIHTYFDTHEFLWVATPILTATDAEGAGARFQVIEEGRRASTDFFGRPAFLTVSGQLEGEALCMGLGRVYTFGPTFRAERSHTSRHLAEFWMIEPEMAFATLDDLIALAEGLLKAVVQHCLTHLAPELAHFAQEGGRSLESWETFLAEPFGRLTYTEAVEQLSQAPSGTFSVLADWGDDLQAEHERWLVAQAGRPLAITHYPKDLKAFYMKDAEDGTVEAMDLLVPGMGELIGGSVRESDLTRLEARLRSAGLDPAAYTSYLDLRRYGKVPHTGFGLGFERLIAYLSGASSVKDVIPFPRWCGAISS